MKSKEQVRLEQLYFLGLKSIFHNGSNWINFIKYSSNHYKYTFTEQVLFYEQDPKAVAIATMTQWNTIYKRRIIAGSKAIRVLDNKSPKGYSANKFDIETTTGSPVTYLWSLSENLIDNILPAVFLEQYNPSLSTEDAISQIVQQTIQLPSSIKDEKLSEYIAKSVSYIVTSKCQLNTSILTNSLEKIFEIPYNLELYSIIGNTVSQQSEKILRQIEKGIKNYDQTRTNQYTSQSVASNDRGKRYRIPSMLSARRYTHIRYVWRSGDGRRKPDSTGIDRTHPNIYTNEMGRSISAVSNQPMPQGTKGAEEQSAREPREKTEKDRRSMLGEVQLAKGTVPTIQQGENTRRLFGESNLSRPNGQYNKRNRAITDVEIAGDIEVEQLTLQKAMDENSIAFLDQVSIVKPTNKIDFLLTEEYTTPKTVLGRYYANIEAIKTLYRVEQENRQATTAEQTILSKYVGWGGCSQVFDDKHSIYTNQNKELVCTLSAEDYASARTSTLSAFYTQPLVIKSIYKALDNFGFIGGNILEPSVGIGNFLGRMPQEMKNKSHITGIEIDNITGRIAKQLYPTSAIQIKGFEEAQIQHNTFDVVLSNIPFGNIKISDKRYGNQYIHDYFFSKALDCVHPGGIVVFITSKGTLDKSGTGARRYMAQHGHLIGAIRLPEGTFADTSVTTDIIFLQKRIEPTLETPNWVYISQDKNGVPVNNYYLDNPHMLLGKMEFDSGMYGADTTTTLKPYKDTTLDVLLDKAIEALQATIHSPQQIPKEEKQNNFLAIDFPDVRNFTYTSIEDSIYYRENAFICKKELPNKQEQKIKALLMIRQELQNVIRIQQYHLADSELLQAQNALNQAYDRFVLNHGYITSPENQRAFSNDMDSNLLSSLENKGAKDTIIKADIFNKRTIKMVKEITKADTPEDALLLSVNMKNKVDLTYMSELVNIPAADLIKKLKGKIFLNPEHFEPHNILVGYETAEEYLSGNVRSKLAIAKSYKQTDPDLFSINVEQLSKSIPKDILVEDINVRLGATWIEEKYINQFIYHLLNVPDKLQRKEATSSDKTIQAVYNKITNSWLITNKFRHENERTTEVYGTAERSAYHIIEDTLNLKISTIKDPEENGDQTTYVYNHNKSVLAREKQNTIKATFSNWIFEDAQRREYLATKYNNLFNNISPRSYDGSNLTLPNLNPNIKLYEHQKDAIARIKTGNNTLLAHAVGAGKSYVMICGAKEQLRLGIANKVAFVVPNHLIDQITKDIYLLYPTTHVLSSTQNDFEPSNRQRFLSKIAFSDVEIVVMGHSQFEKITMSDNYIKEQIRSEIDQTSVAIKNSKLDKQEKYTIKQMELQRVNLLAKLNKLNNSDKKDKHITFEQLGINSIFVDEAHYFKNGAIFSKMQNVAGISNSKAKKASDMQMKCNFINENEGSITFATGTPISNSICEMYVMQRYLQTELLHKKNIYHFDEWAVNFGETKTALELSPEGNGYRMKTRFSNFYNIPELMQMFTCIADIKTADMLNLPTPKLATGKPIIVVCKPSEALESFMNNSIPRVDLIRRRLVQPHLDNMLKFTGDAKKAGLDMRLIDPTVSNDPDGKISKCVAHIYKHYIETSERLGVQVVFCDISTPNANNWNVYDELRNQAIEAGIKPDEIAFIHSAKSKQEKENLFARCRSGEIRLLVGSTQKCGAGTNIQDRLVALHHLDCPYRPSDIEQREGRILRQGNAFDEVSIYRYITEKSFDAYLWSIVTNKAKFIAQIMTSKSLINRSCADVDEAVLNYAEVQAIASGNPLIKEKIELDNKINHLNVLHSAFLRNKYTMQNKILKVYPNLIKDTEKQIKQYTEDIHIRGTKMLGDNFTILLNDRVFTNREVAGDVIIRSLNENIEDGIKCELGEYRNYKLYMYRDAFSSLPFIEIVGNSRYSIEINMASPLGNIMKMDNRIDNIDLLLEDAKQRLDSDCSSLSDLEEQLNSEFEHTDILKKLLDRQTKINQSLDSSAEQGDLTDTLKDNLQKPPSKDIVSSSPVPKQLPAPSTARTTSMQY